MARSSLIPFGGGAFGGSDPVLSLHREMNRLFDDMFRAPAAGRGPSEGAGSIVSAQMNVSETDKEIRVSVELPGVRQDDIDIDLQDDLLTIHGEKRFEQERGGEKENYHFVERAYGSFQRSLRLPFRASPEQVNATFQDGVLTVTIPKSEQQQRGSRIPIQGATAQAGQAPREAERPAGGRQQPGEGQSAPAHH
jgi:HSP20 family protein